MSEDNPSPIWTDGKWRVDMRGRGAGRHVLRCPVPPPEGLADAIHECWALIRETEDKALRRKGQLALGVLFGRVCDLYLEWRANHRRWKSAGGESWSRDVVKRVKKHLGGIPLPDFEGQHGARLLVKFRDMERLRVGAKTVADSLTVIRQVLKFAASPERGWLQSVPEMPDARVDSAERIRNPKTKWVDEATFRAARAAIYADRMAFNMLAGSHKRRGAKDHAAAARDEIERRRLFLSFAFYTGMRKHDLEKLSDASVGVDCSRYVRMGRKTHARPTVEIAPAPLAADLRAERARLGRFYRHGEQITGGAWKNAARVLAAACDRAGVPRFNLMDCRRSFVWHKAAAGVPEETCVRLLGHRDSRMIRAVYLQNLPAAVVDPASAAWPEMPSSDLPGARVIKFPGGEG